MTKEEIIKEIEKVESQISLEKKFNENSENLSFLYWQKHELKNDLKKLEDSK